MSQTRAEIIELRKQRISLLKWKIASVGAIVAVAFNLIPKSTADSAQYVLLGIPPLCLCIDAVCADISIRIHFLGRFLDSLQRKRERPSTDLEEAVALEDYMIRHGMTRDGATDIKKTKIGTHLFQLRNLVDILFQKGFIFFELASLFWSSILFNLAMIAAFAYLAEDGVDLLLVPVGVAGLCVILTEFVAQHLLESRRIMDKWNSPESMRKT